MRFFYTIYALCFFMMCNLDAMGVETKQSISVEVKEAPMPKKVLKTIAALKEFADKFVVATKYAHKHGATVIQALSYAEKNMKKTKREVDKKMKKLSEYYADMISVTWQKTWDEYLDGECLFSMQEWLDAVKLFRHQVNQRLDACYDEICMIEENLKKLSCDSDFEHELDNHLREWQIQDEIDDDRILFPRLF